MSTISGTLYTPDDLLSMPGGDLYELIDGRLQERSMGSWAGFVSGQLYASIVLHKVGKHLGLVLNPDVSYQCFPGNKVRRADLSFIRSGRLPDDRVPEGHIPIPPDLAVEVVSPTDVQYDVDRKVAEYLAAGVRLVWVVNPDTRHVLIFRLDGSIVGVREGGDLDGEDVIPGFRCPVVDLFTP